MIDLSRKGLRKYKGKYYKIILEDSEVYARYIIFERFLFFFFRNIGFHISKDGNISELEDSYKRIIDTKEFLNSLNKELRKERKYKGTTYRFTTYNFYYITIQIKNLFWWKNVTDYILKRDIVHCIDHNENGQFNTSYKNSLITQIDKSIKLIETNYKNMIDFYFYNRCISTIKTNINNKKYIIESHFSLRDNNVKYFIKERFLFFFWIYFRTDYMINYGNNSYSVEVLYNSHLTNKNLTNNKKYNSKKIITEKEQNAIDIIK